MSKHSTGPWDPELSPGRGALSVVSATTWICGEIQNGSIPDEEAWANARLIAAAPDLLEALKLAGQSAGFQYMTTETRSKIDDAIAKAEGRS
ncbi:hypothetical protein [Sinorhizobium meliloti]|uniref:hypothetical protein n=1 Tax=Rhizobium meliloti TaxID=382 RepID=UPI001297040B|nr:hypothetical protein [Sinorhizobium meliloti]MQX28973.1 hypothetical protein [Sinorhizobium meliloti]